MEGVFQARSGSSAYNAAMTRRVVPAIVATAIALAALAVVFIAFGLVRGGLMLPSEPPR